MSTSGSALTTGSSAAGSSAAGSSAATNWRDAYLEVRTPEGIVFTLPLAGPMRRMLAMWVDTCVVSLLTYLANTILTVLQLFGEDMAGGVTMVAGFAIFVLYGILSEYYGNGQTLGKRLLRLRVLDAEAKAPTLSQIVVRNLVRIADTLPAMYLLGGIATLVTRNQQRLGDLAARTVVIRMDAESAADWSQIFRGKFNSMASQLHLAARLRQRTDPRIAAIALDAILRRDELDPEARVQLFSQLAGYFRPLVTFPAETVEALSDEQYVRNAVEILYRGKG